MAAPAPRPPTAAETRRQLNRDVRRLAQAAWRALSPAQRCSADTVSTILSMFSLSEISRASTVCRDWRAGAAKVTRVSGFDGRVFNAAKKITATDAVKEAQQRYAEAAAFAVKHFHPPPLPVTPRLAEEPLQVGSRLHSLLSSPLRRHVHTLDESMVDASTPPQNWLGRWDSDQHVSPPRPFSFPPTDRWSGSWSLAELRGLSALPHLTRLLDCTVQLRDFVFRSVATSHFEFPRRLVVLSLQFEWSEPHDPNLSVIAHHSAHKADLATCLPIFQALVGCSALTSLSLQTTLPLQFDLSPLAELPSLERLEVDCPLAHCADRLHLVPALRQIELNQLSLNMNAQHILGFPDDLTRALFTRPHKLDGLRKLQIGYQRFDRETIDALLDGR